MASFHPRTANKYQGRRHHADAARSEQAAFERQRQGKSPSRKLSKEFWKQYWLFRGMSTRGQDTQPALSDAVMTRLRAALTAGDGGFSVEPNATDQEVFLAIHGWLNDFSTMLDANRWVERTLVG